LFEVATRYKNNKAAQNGQGPQITNQGQTNPTVSGTNTDATGGQNMDQRRIPSDQPMKYFI